MESSLSILLLRVGAADVKGLLDDAHRLHSGAHPLRAGSRVYSSVRPPPAHLESAWGYRTMPDIENRANEG